MNTLSRVSCAVEREVLRSESLPSRSEFFAAAAAAVERGDWAALPVLPEPFPVEEVCETCRGTGYERRGPGRLALCLCMGNDDHPGFDLERRASRPSWAERLDEGRDGVTRVWSLCGACTIAPALNGTAAAAALLWRPDCLTCRDTGWAHPRVLSP
ncbi:hypothetical protein, partial [Actinomadura formosensis]|uniref:hypothetical protein n=2 Tax=Actinomadura formosensis TaxID=60706 RepID=UPI0010412925